MPAEEAVVLGVRAVNGPMDQATKKNTVNTFLYLDIEITLLLNMFQAPLILNISMN